MFSKMRAQKSGSHFVLFLAAKIAKTLPIWRVVGNLRTKKVRNYTIMYY
jgi:hypothetical protein